MKKIILCVFILLMSVNVFAADIDIEQLDIKQLAEAANKGDAEAQYRLAIQYCLEDDIDDTKVTYWLQKAAEQGHNVAQKELGNYYALGYGVPQSHEQANYWYQKAAEQGNIDAQLFLGMNYELGRGIPKNNKLAYKWYILCFVQVPDTELAEVLKTYLEDIKQDMTEEQITEAHDMAAEWMERHR